MASFNKVILAGNVTRDVEVKYLPNGTAVANVGLAVNEKWTDAQGNKKEATEFIDCTLWKRNAELAGEYLRKGSPVLFEGKLKTESWDKDGVKHTKTKVEVQHMQFLGGKQDGGGKSGGGQQRQSSQGHGGNQDDEVPF